MVLHAGVYVSVLSKAGKYTVTLTKERSHCSCIETKQQNHIWCVHKCFVAFAHQLNIKPILDRAPKANTKKRKMDDMKGVVLAARKREDSQVLGAKPNERPRKRLKKKEAAPDFVEVSS